MTSAWELLSSERLGQVGRRILTAKTFRMPATPAEVGQGDVSWTVLADPEGDEFCLLTPR